MGDQLRSLAQVLAETDQKLRSGVSAGARVWPTGLGALDDYLGGGIRSGELALLGGPQGLGKTTLALQILRHAASTGRSCVYFSFEHDAHTMLERLLAIEATEVEGVPALPLRRLREVFEARHSAPGSLDDRMADVVGGREAIEAMREYGRRVHLHSSSGASTTIDAVRGTVEQVHAESGHPPLVIVDYLQKVRVNDAPPLEDDRVTIVVEGLKDLALDAGVPVLAIVAADKSAIGTGKRLRVQHLRGSSALAYEADIVLLINDKYDVVARHHLVYDLGNAERFRDWVVLSIEKNRGGQDKVDLEFRKRFEVGKFDPHGKPVAERLTDDRVFRE